MKISNVCEIIMTNKKMNRGFLLFLSLFVTLLGRDGFHKVE